MPAGDGAIAHLFVYGTLRRDAGHEMHRLLALHGRRCGRGSVVGRLYDLGPYPGAVPDEPGGPGGAPGGPGTHRLPDSAPSVRGEVYLLERPSVALEDLDRYEGCAAEDPHPHDFVRASVTVKSDDGDRIRAWIYWYRGSLEGAEPVPTGDYLDVRRP